jgi:hypothetical protein
MNTAFPAESTTPEATESPGVPRASVVQYIDADNQSHQCAKALVSLFRTVFDARVVSATNVGNNHGKQIDRWRDELVSALPDLVVHPLAAPDRKQGADVALLMALGANLERHIRDGEVVVIVSRDELVIAAAEQIKARGCRTLIAYADSDVPTARNPDVTTLLLPAVATPVSVPRAAPAVAPAATATPPARPPDQAPGGDVESVIAQLRGMCTQQPGGGYSASDVGQALSKLGYDKAKRKRFLESVPGLSVRGTGANKVLEF